MLLLHILIALISVVVATRLVFFPSARYVMISYATIGATFASGIALIMIEPATILHACVSGIMYTTLITVLSIVAHRRIQQTA